MVRGLRPADSEELLRLRPVTVPHPRPLAEPIPAVRPVVAIPEVLRPVARSRAVLPEEDSLPEAAPVVGGAWEAVAVAAAADSFNPVILNAKI